MPLERTRTRLLLAVIVVLLLAVVAAVAVVRLLSHEEGLTGALRLTPADTQRVSWTDWAGVRREVGAGVSGDSSPAQIEGFLDDAFTEDLASTTALVASAPTMQAELGVSPATIEWEMFAQGDSGAVVAMGMGEGFDGDDLAGRLDDLGFTEPDDDPTDGGVWRGGTQVLAQIGGTLTPELQHFAILDDVVLASDQAGYLETAVEVARGDADRLESTEAVVDTVVDAGEEPLAASVYTGSYACGRLAMAGADSVEQTEGEDLLARAGEVNPMTGMALARGADGLVRVAMSFETEEQARTNADTRAALASGPAPGQGGDFSDRFTVESAGAEGDVVILALKPVDGSYVLSDLGSGPVLFATC